MATTQRSISRDEFRARTADAAAGIQRLRARALESRADLRSLGETLRNLELEPATRGVRKGYWHLVRAGLGVLVTVPRLVVDGLGRMSRAADDVTRRSEHLAERGREVAGRVPPSRAERRRQRRGTLVVTAAAFGAGIVTGWLLARRPGSDPLYAHVDETFASTELSETPGGPEGDGARSSPEGTGTAEAPRDGT